MRSSKPLTSAAAVLVAVILLGTLSCTTDYVTGKKTFSLVSESQEVQMGREADPEIVAEYGAYDNAALTQYVNGIGQALAAKSQRKDIAYTFRVLDTPVVNAFALPGGYVYVTRGILAHFESEDQLAGVVGHEIGHVVARHSAEQMSNQQLASLGLGVGSLVSETFQKYAQIAGMGLQLMFLKYSRTQESEADLLGVEYSTKVGYDASEMAAFFGTLEKMGEGSGQSLPSFLSTHPDPGDRQTRVRQLTKEWQQKVAYKPLGKDPGEYLKRLEGIVYGDDPRQGYTEGQMFYHPSMRFQFPVPTGWQVVNSASTVAVASADGKGVVQMALAGGTSPGGAADSFVTRNGLTVQNRRTRTIHGFSAVEVTSTGKTDSGEIRVLSCFIKKDANVYAFHGYSASSVFSNYSAAFSNVIGGFEEVRDQAVLSKKPQKLHIKKAPKSGDLASVLKTLGMKDEMLKEGALLNAMDLTDTVQQGSWVKVVGN